ncbi:MAG: TFIIB-type zinc ribbon-containing protein [Comamonadaceae bacterium]|nr:MAG: TFIIB-type zinc ribbon-containing protein [Comamonadaceae bacterium]
MTINLQTLKCAECGGGVLERTGLNQYVCAHCASVSVVEDDVSERLDRVLEQVKDAAADRLTKEQAARRAQQLRMLGLGIGAFAVLSTIAVAVVVLSPRAQRAAPAAVALLDRTIPVDGLKLTDARQVLVGSGSSARPRLFVMARNETGKVLEAPRITVQFYDGETRLSSRSESVPVVLMQPGDVVPMLVDLPGAANVTRQEFEVARLSSPHRAVDGARLAFSRVRLVEQKDELRLVGRLANTQPAATLAGVQVLATGYDEAGTPIALGRGYLQPSEIRPGDRGMVDVRLERFGGSAAVAAWDYRIDHYVDEAEGGRAAVVVADRGVRTAGGPERFNPELRMSTEDFLAEDGERFDLAQLELLPLIPGLNTIRQRTYMTELVNRSADTIAVTPAAVISRFDGNRLDGTTRIGGIAYLYPGERIPVQVDPDRADRITQTRVEWKPLRRATLPGARTPLEVQVTGTEARIGSVLLNFSQRFSYKAVEVRGQVRNPGTAIVRKARVWVSLRDKGGRLTGFKQIENLPAIAPGDSVPFEVRIEQQGADFASVSTVYQTTD